MNIGAVIMLLIGAVGLWGGLIVAIRHYFAAVNRERSSGNEGATGGG
ncbi:Hypothetical Protein RradSPS_0317 [Rubrobacter radiotolerans]|uniref:MetS family NSS transporter small subunit n=1 Tax=Rubrobacter radiotolerans TaxID=42256 RepID=A0A023X0T2_RUBRA|nr:MetS family NSS transporter small subunit [Rubrobacter radiotolerans]AHY45600.1 Hypothetical Protein RradSPS_0317 [Rubrobacter radiotolerans]MDX5893013.1 MetS family NSS transporter small subunit [Rubrobacter radiotolerans]SMC02902.1 conserved hypothetical protein [Rubrobacter radiotolerans DSM 5868]